MRLGILDVGSNTVHLLVVDAEPGARPVPAADHRWDSPLLHQVGDAQLAGFGVRLLDYVVQLLLALAAHGVVWADLMQQRRVPALVGGRHRR